VTKQDAEAGARRVIREIWPTIAADLSARRARGEDLSELAVVIAVDGDGVDSMLLSRAKAGQLAARMGSWRMLRKLARAAPPSRCWVMVIVGGKVYGELVTAVSEESPAN
jgi:hypothetical protein